MFTGIVDHQGRLQKVEKAELSSRLLVAHQFGELAPGESVSVDGVCLTVTAQTPEAFWCELSLETLQRSISGAYQIGQPVNLERALCLGDRMGGHWVTGHVDTVGRVEKTERISEFTRIYFSGIPFKSMRYLIPKGSVAVNGVSLTVNGVSPAGFDVMLIPHTLERTGLGRLEQGSPVNLEWDWMTKTIVQETERILAERVKDT